MPTEEDRCVMIFKRLNLIRFELHRTVVFVFQITLLGVKQKTRTTTRRHPFLYTDVFFFASFAKIEANEACPIRQESRGLYCMKFPPKELQCTSKPLRVEDKRSKVG